MKKLLVFPSDFENINLLRNLDMIDTYKSIVVLSLNGSGQIGKNLSVIDKGSPTKITIQSEDILENELLKCDDLLLLKSNFILNFENEIFPIITKAISLNKRILCNFLMPDEYWQRIASYDNIIAPNRLIYLQRPNPLPEVIGNTAIYEFETPIVFISGLNERTDKLFSLLSIRRHLSDIGYKTSCIISNGCGELINAHSYPSYMFEPINEAQKIVLLNEYIKSIEQEERPDIILISIPGAAMPYNFKNTNYFGVQNFLVGKAAPPDVVVCCVNYAEISDEYINSVVQYYETRFACRVLGIIMNNISYDTYLTLSPELEFSSVQPEIVDNALKKIRISNLALISKFDNKGIRDLADKIVSFFSADSNPTQL